MTVHSRIAPTPSGLLHLGNAFNFLLIHLLVRSAGGVLRLRIDDLDARRVRPEYIADIFETLSWLGIGWDEGPGHAGAAAAFSQSLRLPRYEALLQELAAGGGVFACTCSRQAIQSQSTDGQYPGTCRNIGLPLDTPNAAWRLVTPPGTVVAFPDGILGEQTLDLYTASRDFIVRRRDGIPAYHIASLADDVGYGINTIVRGADLLVSTAVQLSLARRLALHSFLQTRFYHHPLLAGPDGRKLSKSAGSTSIRSVREANGRLPEVLKTAARWLEEVGVGRLLPVAALQALRAGKQWP